MECGRGHMSRYSYRVFVVFFFFQAEDGIRDLTVTGVQTCALPISYQGYTSIRMYLSDSTANYNAFQVYATKRKGDFMATVSYTWSKTLADSSGLGANPDNWRDRKYNYGVADFDRRHVFATTYFYDVPFLRNRGGVIGTALGGWQLSGITRAQSGPPISILANFPLADSPLGNATVNGRRAD